MIVLSAHHESSIITKNTKEKLLRAKAGISFNKLFRFHHLTPSYNQWHTEGGVWGVQPPPPNSEVLTKSNWIAN